MLYLDTVSAFLNMNKGLDPHLVKADTAPLMSA